MKIYRIAKSNIEAYHGTPSKFSKFDISFSGQGNDQEGPAWYHSHQKATILSLVEGGYGDTFSERSESGQPAVYKVKFADGLEWDVFEDELMDSPDGFYRPDPPSISQEDSDELV